MLGTCVYMVGDILRRFSYIISQGWTFDRILYAKMIWTFKRDHPLEQILPFVSQFVDVGSTLNQSELLGPRSFDDCGIRTLGLDEFLQE